MSSDPRSFLEFFERQQAKHAARFPALRAEQVLAFMGTTSLAGTLRVLLRPPAPPARRAARAAGAPDRARRDALPRPPAPGECVTVHLTRVERYQGYQVKTRALAPGTSEAELVEAAPDGIVVKGAQIYTVHHSPYTLQFFESVPYEEVEETLAGLGHALVAVGETANLSPRFVFHHEVQDGKVLLFHGDGLALKTYMNVRQNRSETRLVLDLDDFTGFALRGTVEEFAPHQHPEAYERICHGFQAGGWGKPSRVFRFAPESFEPIAPVGRPQRGYRRVRRSCSRTAAASSPRAPAPSRSSASPGTSARRDPALRSAASASSACCSAAEGGRVGSGCARRGVTVPSSIPGGAGPGPPASPGVSSISPGPGGACSPTCVLPSMKFPSAAARAEAPADRHG